MWNIDFEKRKLQVSNEGLQNHNIFITFILDPGFHEFVSIYKFYLETEHRMSRLIDANPALQMKINGQMSN